MMVLRIEMRIIRISISSLQFVVTFFVFVFMRRGIWGKIEVIMTEILWSLEGFNSKWRNGCYCRQMMILMMMMRIMIMKMMIIMIKKVNVIIIIFSHFGVKKNNLSLMHLFIFKSSSSGKTFALVIMKLWC